MQNDSTLAPIYTGDLRGESLDFGDGPVTWVEVDAGKMFAAFDDDGNATGARKTAAEYALTWPRGGFMSASA